MDRPVVYGDAAYGTGGFHELLGGAGIESRCKTQAPTAAGGLFSKDRFDIDLQAGTATCPAGVTTPFRFARSGDGSGIAYFGPVCAACPLRAQCTTAKGGRTISIGPHEQALADARARQADPAWVADYRATRPKVERKLGHLMRRRHGGRRARVRGTDTGRRRLPVPRRRGQPRPDGRARGVRRTGCGLGGGDMTSVSTAPARLHGDQRAWRNTSGSADHVHRSTTNPPEAT